MTQKQIENKIQEIRSKAGDTFFSVHFIKKNGDYRKMVARFNVKKGITGKGLSFSPTKKGMFVVFDVQKQAYRMVTVDKIRYLKIKKVQLVNRWARFINRFKDRKVIA